MENKLESQISTDTKKMVQILRFELKKLSDVETPKSVQMLNVWVNCFGFSDWQCFIRHSKGVKVNKAEINNYNLNEISIKIKEIIPCLTVRQVKGAIITAHFKATGINLLEQHN